MPAEGVRRTIAKALSGRKAPTSEEPSILDQLDEFDRSVIDKASPYSMTGPVRMHAAMEAVRYVVDRDLPGAIVECGVWRGGTVLAMVSTLLERGCTDRDVYLYDTFEGMTQPTEFDTSDYSPAALEEWNRATGDGRAWGHWFDGEIYDIDLVRGLLAGTGYPAERVHFVKGPVEETIPGTVPDAVAVLRLDTDWYESTAHEMEHLYPLLQPGGVLIIDDYGHWQGSRKAVDEYFAVPGRTRPLLHRVDYTCRSAVKP